VNISLTRQIKLLEVLLTGTMQRLGAARVRSVDVRLIADSTCEEIPRPSPTHAPVSARIDAADISPKCRSSPVCCGWRVVQADAR